MHVAELLRSYTRSSDFAARIGYDEFVILSENSGEFDNWLQSPRASSKSCANRSCLSTGHAPIITPTKIRPQRLKIDRQLVMPLVRSARQRRLLGTIVEMAKSLEISVIAEGVETRRHAAILADLWCDAIQGYGFALPMSAVDLPEFLRRQTWRQERTAKRQRRKRNADEAAVRPVTQSQPS